MIYFIRDGEFVKIGFTDKDDYQGRMTDLQIGNPRQLVLIGTMEGNEDDERDLHRTFRDFYIRGEWFFLALAIREFIERHCGQSVPWQRTRADGVMDEFNEFATRCLEKDQNGSFRPSALKNIHDDWCTASNIPPMHDATFGKMVTRFIIENGGTRLHSQGTLYRGFRIKLKEARPIVSNEPDLFHVSA